MDGQRTCQTHGGRARHSVEAARRRLMEQADPAVRQLQKISFDELQSSEIRLKATLALIDRAGLSPKTTVELGPIKPFETIFEEMESGGSRAAFRGETVTEAIEPPQRELPAADDDEALEVEILDGDEDSWPMPEHQPEQYNGLDEHSGPSSSPFASSPPPDGLMTLEAAVSAAAVSRRNALQRKAIR